MRDRSFKSTTDSIGNLTNFTTILRLQADYRRVPSGFWYVICEQGEGCLQRDICRAVCVSKQTIHSAIRKLEEDGYLYMKSGRGRDKHIFLTERGSLLAEEKIRPVMEIENAAFDALGETESCRLLELTEQYFHALVEQTEKARQNARKEGRMSE